MAAFAIVLSLTQDNLYLDRLIIGLSVIGLALGNGVNHKGTNKSSRSNLYVVHQKKKEA